MRGARGAEIDANFHEGPALPGMPGTARVHRNDEYWATLYEGTDEGAATAAWKTAGTLVQSCLSPDWSAGHRDWTTMALKFDQSVTWEEREVRWILPAGEEIVLITLSEEHRSTKAEASLYLYVTEPK